MSNYYNLDEDLVKEMASMARHSIDTTIINTIVNVEIKKIIENSKESGEELPDWVIEYLADKI